MKNLGKVGVCLAGSGSRGIWQFGAIKALRDLGIQADSVFTSSSGTLNSLLYVAGEIDQLEQVWLNIRTKDIYNKNMWSFAQALTSKAAIYDSKPLFNTIKKCVHIDKLRNSKSKLFINATNLSDFSIMTLSIDEMTDEEVPMFAYASASPPIFFPTVNFRGQELTDSGVTNNYGIINALKDGCDTIIAICPSIIEPHKSNNLVDMIKNVMSLSMQIDLPKEVKSIEKINDIIDKVNETLPNNLDLKKVNLIMITPDKPLHIDFLNFEYPGYNRKDIIEYGYNLAMERLKAGLA